MKTRYEESDNLFVRATRTVTDKMTELFGTLQPILLVLNFRQEFGPREFEQHTQYELCFYYRALGSP